MLNLPEEAVRIIDRKFAEYNLEIPMIRAMMNGKVKPQPAASIGSVSHAGQKSKEMEVDATESHRVT